MQDPATGQLNAENITEQTTHTLYTNIQVKYYCKLVYDDLRKRLLVLYGLNTGANNLYNRQLIFDLRLNAVIKYAFAVTTASLSYVMDISVIRESSLITADNKLLYSCSYDTPTINPFWFFARLSRDAAGGGYLDNGNLYTAYVQTSYEMADSPVSRKQVPYVWVFSKKTETGFTDTGTDLVPVEPSSTTMLAVWDFTNNLLPGKSALTTEVYRHKNTYASDDLDYNDGRPVVVTKNLVRGSGKVLQLRFYNADVAKASWIMGWHVRYKSGGRAG